MLQQKWTVGDIITLIIQKVKIGWTLKEGKYIQIYTANG